MAELTVRSLRDCILALQKKDRELAYAIILRDQRIDAMEKEIDHLCLEFILRHQPAASHLRFIYGALQTNFELERVGDYAESIARQIIKLADIKGEIPVGLFTEIASTSVSMLRDAVTAFVGKDADLATVTAITEERVDALRNQVNGELLRMLERKQIPLEALTPLMTISRRFERVSDQAKSICQETIYFCTGEYAKHQDGQVYRVFFVDEHGTVSWIAETIGTGLKRPEFIFASASVDPRPIPEEAVRYVREQGFKPSAAESKPLRDETALEQYHVVVTLSKTDKAMLPAPTRKSAQFAWTIPDPSATAGSAVEVRAAYDEAYTGLSGRISGLVEAILGEELS
jgi:phosphate transport system protein